MVVLRGALALRNEEDMEEEPNRKQSHKVLAICAIAGVHWSSIMLPISLSYPHHVLSLSTAGLVVIPHLGKWGLLVTGVCVLINGLSLAAIFLLLMRWNFRIRWFYSASMGTTVTMLFCLFFGALWNIFFMVAIWVAFGNRKHQFHSNESQG
jgi:hypothetical protein